MYERMSPTPLHFQVILGPALLYIKWEGSRFTFASLNYSLSSKSPCIALGKSSMFHLVFFSKIGYFISERKKGRAETTTKKKIQLGKNPKHTANWGKIQATQNFSLSQDKTFSKQNFARLRASPFSFLGIKGKTIFLKKKEKSKMFNVSS